MDNVASAVLRSSADLYVADVTMRPGHSLPMSDVEKALEAANRAMGDSMGTKYDVDASLALSSVHRLKTRARPDEVMLNEDLGELPGFVSVATDESGFSPVFQGDELPSLDDVKKAAGLDVTDVVLAPSKDGFRFYCPMHPEIVSAEAMKCPICELPLVKAAASTPAKVDPIEKPERKAGG